MSNPATFTAESVAKGEVLAAEGHCLSCHIRPGGQPFAGGYGVNTPFGIIYGSNITPDPKTGIGGWSLEAFTRAMREGVSRDGSHLFAAFPFNAYTELQDDDVKALYAYLMTRPAVSATVPPMTVPFPLNVRFLQEGWSTTPTSYNTGTVPLAARPELALNSALSLPEPTNFIQAVLRGIGGTEGAPGLVMPAYASSFTDPGGESRGLSASDPHDATTPDRPGEKGICCPARVEGIALKE